MVITLSKIAIEGRMPHEIIFAITLLDLPFDLDADVRLKSGYGATWEFIATRCDDAYVDVIERIISMCNHHQLRELCFFRGYYEPEVGDDKEEEKENIRSVISRATPKVHEALRRSLRFMGRYEFVSGKSCIFQQSFLRQTFLRFLNYPEGEALFVDTSLGLKIFDAADFGSKEDPLPESRRVILRCYGDEHRCYDDVRTVYIYLVITRFCNQCLFIYKLVCRLCTFGSIGWIMHMSKRRNIFELKMIRCNRNRQKMTQQANFA